MIKFNTLLRVVYTLGVYLILSQSAFAQSTLNFARTTVNDRLKAGFAVTNPTSSYADVQFTLYGLDGNPVSSGLVNPVRYRVAPNGQLSMLASDLFAGSNVDGWVQATSATSGLIGFYLSGDFATDLRLSEASPAFATQVIPAIRDDQTSKTEISVLNPADRNTNVILTLFDARGADVGTISFGISPHAVLSVRPSVFSTVAGGSLSLRISASTPVVAVATVEKENTLLYVPGQAIDQLASVRLGSYFANGNGFRSTLVLTNPNASEITVGIAVFNKAGVPVVSSPSGPFSRRFSIPGNGTISLEAPALTGLPIPPAIEGWVVIDSPNVALDGLVIVEQGSTTVALPLQTSPLKRMIYSAISESQTLFSSLVLVNPSSEQAEVNLALIQQDGTTVSRKTVRISPNSQSTGALRDLLSEPNAQSGRYLFIDSSVPLYGLGMLGSTDHPFLANMTLRVVPDGFVPNRVSVRPRVSGIDQGTDVQSGQELRVRVENVGVDAVFYLSDQIVQSRPEPLDAFIVSLPSLDPGFVNLRVRSNGVDSDPVSLHIGAPDNFPTQTISGKAFYQKIEVTDAGLDLSHPFMVPIRNARVEAVDRASQAVIAVSETDARGQFRLPVPLRSDLTIRVLSRMRFTNLRIADNTNASALYSISADIDGREPRSNLLLADNSRLSGAFNILDMIERSNDLIQKADAKIVTPQVVVFWSTRNTSVGGNISQGQIGGTYFNFTNNTAFILGDRADDSDEFDDSVIIHEYAHLLAARFSRDDSPGHSHGIGDLLDPRVAWSEGWANFFSAAVRNDPIFRDSAGPNGNRLRLRYDLEDNIPPGDQPGYWSEASVDGLLWDLFDDHVDAEDSVRYPFSLIWGAFTDLKNDRFVYLPYFLDHFIERDETEAGVLREMVQYRSIDFQPGVRPSVTNPFPRLINVGEAKTGSVDSLTSRRPNLTNSAHFFSFTTTGGAASIRLEITGTGPGRNPNANDLDLFLMDTNGRLLDRSDRGLNGQSELIPIRLPAGTYIIEVRSYYTNAATGGLVFNSGDYRLSLAVQ